jgi:hypothetical protein
LTFRLFERRSIPCPTLLGSGVLLLVILTPLLVWGRMGEKFLRLNHPAAPDVLVVEGWIGMEGCRAAAKELALHPYRYVVVTGGTVSAHWNDRPGNYTSMAAWELERSGVPEDKIIRAPAKDVQTQRTYEMAVAVRRALSERGLLGADITVFTHGPHARRSRLIFRKTLGPDAKVGVISWAPTTDEGRAWWDSTERTEDFAKETVAWLAELLLNSGRSSKPSLPAATP